MTAGAIGRGGEAAGLGVGGKPKEQEHQRGEPLRQTTEGSGARLLPGDPLPILVPPSVQTALLLVPFLAASGVPIGSSANGLRLHVRERGMG